jgi:hypothetical protein
MNNIGAAIDYDARAQQYAPKTAEEIEQAPRDLAVAGHSNHTIAAILRADVNAVRTMIGPPAQ